MEFRGRFSGVMSTLGLTFLFVSLSSSLFAETPVEGSELSVEQETSAIIQFSEDVQSAEQKADTLAKEYDADVEYVYNHAIKGASLDVPQSQMDQLLSEEDVSTMTQERRMEIVGFSSTDQTAQSRDKQDLTKKQVVPEGMKRIRADEVDQYDAHSDVNVAVVDTGIEPDHPDLNVEGGVNFVGSDKSNWEDGHIHGTHVAGIIGARDNEIGTVGVAPKADLYSVRVMDPGGSGGAGGILAGIDWVADPSNDIDVVNMSLGGPALTRLIPNDPFQSAIKNVVDSGVAIAVAAGNSGLPAIGFVPAGYGQTTTVTAINPRNDEFAEFSNYGVMTDVIAAPGVQSLSAVPDENARNLERVKEKYLNDDIKGPYMRLNGTSMASPHVAGGMALLLGQNPNLSPKQVEEALMNEGISGEWKNHPFLSRTMEPLLNAAEMADGVNKDQTKTDSVQQ